MIKMVMVIDKDMNDGIRNNFRFPILAYVIFFIVTSIFFNFSNINKNQFIL